MPSVDVIPTVLLRLSIAPSRAHRGTQQAMTLLRLMIWHEGHTSPAAARVQLECKLVAVEPCRASVQRVAPLVPGTSGRVFPVPTAAGETMGSRGPVSGQSGGRAVVRVQGMVFCACRWAITSDVSCQGRHNRASALPGHETGKSLKRPAGEPSTGGYWSLWEIVPASASETDAGHHSTHTRLRACEPTRRDGPPPGTPRDGRVNLAQRKAAARVRAADFGSRDSIGWRLMRPPTHPALACADR